MNSLKELVFDLANAKGYSHQSGNALEIAKKHLSKYGIVEENVLGSLVCSVSPKKEGKPHFMLDAHLDEVAMMVTAVNKSGFLSVTDAAGMDPRVLASSEVLVHTETADYYGIVTSTPPHLSDPKNYKTADKITEIFIDVGFDEETAKKKIPLGSYVTLKSASRTLIGERIRSKALDDRAGCAAILRALEKLGDTDLSEIGLSVSFTSLEEFGGQGAKTTAFAIEPTHAIVVDACPSDQDFHESAGLYLGAGTGIRVAAILNREMTYELAELCEKNEIPHKLKVEGGRQTGTNADDIAVSASGVKTALLFIPQRYAHTTNEIMELSDIEHTANLIATYLKQKAGA